MAQRTTEAGNGEPDVLLYSDGACSPNPGTGGWGVVLVAPRHEGQRKELSGAEFNTTNNRMELMAVIEGLRAVKRPSRVRIITDSLYVKKAFTEGWLKNWIAGGWRTAGKKAVKNVELWQELMKEMEIHDIEWAWVRGHAETPENNRADELAVEARKRLLAQGGAPPEEPNSFL